MRRRSRCQGCAESLAVDRVDVMPTLFKERDKPQIEVLVELEPHVSDTSEGTGITRSRVISAAYAKQARMSSGRSDG
jgi:hypothetical protein